MKIVFLLHSYYKYSFGGAEYQVYLIAQYLLRKGYEIHYVFLGENRSYPKIDNGIKLHPVYKKRPLIYKLFGKSYLVFGNEINSILKNIDPDFIYHRNFSSIFLSAIKYSGRIKCKTILHIAHKCDVNKNCVNFGSNIIRNIYNRIVKNKCLKKVDYIIAQAKYQDELLRYNYNRKADLIMKNMHPYPNGKLVKSEQLKVLWISNLKEWKQPEKFIQLAKESEYTNAEFIMIGRDPKNEWSEGFKKRISEIKNLSYLGELPIKRVNEFLAESHILVNTSLYEGFPNTFIQAWMRKVPVVSLNVDPDDVLKQNEIGYHSISFDKMINDVKFLISNNKLRDEMGEKAQKYAFKNHSLKNIGKLIGLIEDEKNNI